VKDVKLGENVKQNGVTIKWSDIIPDFIMVETTKTENLISIIDAKLASHPHISHKMQIALYTRLLDQFMGEYCDSPKNMRLEKTADKGVYIVSSGKKKKIVRINHEYGYLWNRTEDMKNIVSEKQKLDWAELKDYLCKFELEPEYRYLDEFFEEKLPGIIGKIDKRAKKKDTILKKLDFCITTNCEGCGNWEKCLQWGDDTQSIQLYPYLSRRAQQFIVDLAHRNKWNILTVDGMREFTKHMRL
jgi:hypothetical protein